MYRKTYNEYERRAEEIRNAAQAIEKGERPSEYSRSIHKTPRPALPERFEERGQADTKKKNPLSFLDGIFDRFEIDDIILLALMFLLIQEKDSDKMLLIILGYLFLSGM